MSFATFNTYAIKIANIVICPFTHRLWLFAAFFLLSSAVSLIDAFLGEYGNVMVVVNCLIVNAFTAYILSLISCCCLRIGGFRFVGKVIVALMLFVAALIFVVDANCYLFIESPLNADYALILKATNKGEASEFFETYFNVELLARTFIPLLCIVGIAWMLRRRHINLGRKISYCLVGSIVLSAVAFAWHGIAIFEATTIGKVKLLCTPMSDMPNLAEYRSNPKLVYNDDKEDENIVIIVGESLCREKMSLYGYVRPTTPRLDKLFENGKLIRFETPEAHSVSTIESFTKFLTTYRGEDSIRWYCCPTIIEIMQLAGYRCEWLSNQAKSGAIDRGISCFADLCDDAVFVGNKYAGLQKRDLDESLFPAVDSVIQHLCGRNFIIVHLMGQHEEFSRRYPDTYSRFKASEYGEYPDNQRETLSRYDNSVLYNDFVVDSIMRSFDGTNTVVLYFSDHALDLYDSTPDMAKHGNHQNKISEMAASKIPFVVYETDLYRRTHADIDDRLRSNISHKFILDDLIYTVMDIAGIGFADNADVENYSVITESAR
jgi:heptose-I-phosphate ethanolaminephosphotransferase